MRTLPVLALCAFSLGLAAPAGAAEIVPLTPEPAPAPAQAGSIGGLARLPYPSHFLDAAGLATLPKPEGSAYTLGLLDGLLLGPDATMLGWSADALADCLEQHGAEAVLAEAERDARTWRSFPGHEKEVDASGLTEHLRTALEALCPALAQQKPGTVVEIAGARIERRRA